MISFKSLHRAFYFSFAALFFLNLIPMEATIKLWMPDWILVWVTAWTIIEPKLLGVTKIAIAGLLVDLILGSPLGTHMISYILVGMLCFRVRSTFKFYPLWQQTMLYSLYGMLSALILYWLNSLLVQQPLGWEYWGQVLGFTLCWPVVFMLAQGLMRVSLHTHRTTNVV